MDFLLLYGFLFISVSGYILWFILPMGQGLGGVISVGNCGWLLSGMGAVGNDGVAFGLLRYHWIELHSWVSVIVVMLVLIHILFHWQWIMESTKRLRENILKSQKAILERYITGSILFVLTAIEVLSGFIVWIIMPRGRGDLFVTSTGYGRTFWGLQRNEWVDMHAWVAVFMIAIIVVHVIIHWRWIVNMTLGRMKAKKTEGTIEPEVHYQVDKLKVGLRQPNYLPRIGILLGLIGAIGFLVAILTFQFDQFGRYDYMFYLIPIPFIILILARKWPFVSSVFLIILGIITPMLYLIFPISILWNKVGVWNELGWETVYTVVFVTLPLIASGSLFLLSDRFKKKNKMEGVQSIF